FEREKGDVWKWYARVVEERDLERRRRDHVYLVHEEALRHNPGDRELERKCAELALELKRYSDARGHLKDLLGCDLRLMSSVKDVERLPREGKNLIVVAAVGQVVHVRIFDSDGKTVVDTDETRLKDRVQQIAAVKRQLDSLWPPHELTGNEKD